MLSENLAANFLPISFRHITHNQLVLIARRKKNKRKREERRKISKK
jgi:hypothetical protein